MNWYGQQEEDRLIAEHMARHGIKKGRFLDIGASDGRANSNTIRLAESGWEGTCVEPDSRAFSLLVEEHKGRPVRCVQAAVVVNKGPGLVTFWRSADSSIGTVDKRHKATWETQANVVYSPIVVACTGVEGILEVCPGPYHVVSIDTEGTSDVLAMRLPWQSLQTRIAVIEHGYEESALVEHMTRAGFYLLQKNDNNMVWTR